MYTRTPVRIRTPSLINRLHIGGKCKFIRPRTACSHLRARTSSHEFLIRSPSSVVDMAAGVSSLVFWTLSAAIFLNLVAYLVALLRVTMWNPYKLHRIMRQRGYGGPPLSWTMHNRDEAAEIFLHSRTVLKPIFGTVDHNIRHRVLPHYFEWSRRYGTCLITSSILLTLDYAMQFLKVTAFSL